MKKYLLIFLITLLAFQACICQEVGEDEVDTIDDSGMLPIEDEDEAAGDEGEWAVLNLADITPGGVADKSSSFGVWWVKAEKIGNDQIANSTWNLNKSNSMFSRDAGDGYTDYKFNVTETDQNNNNFTTEYVVRASDNQDETILYRVLSYISRTYEASAVGVAPAGGLVETSTTYSILEEQWQYGNDSTLQQYLAPITFAPESDTVLTNNWVDVDEQTWTTDTTLQDWSKTAGTAAIEMAYSNELIDSISNWYVYYIYPSSQVFGDITYYRFDFILSNNANTQLARGNSYVTKDASGNYQLLTSAISSMELAS